MVLAAVLYRILLSLERDTRQVQAEYRDNVAWYAGQFERELSALVQTLDSYHLGEAGVTKDDLAERMDVFWSRVDSAGSGTVGATFMSFEGVPPLIIAEARRALRDIEPVVLALQPGDATAHQMIKQRLDGLPSAFHAAALLALHQQNGDMAGLHRRMAKGHSELLLIFAGVLTGSAILIGLILFKMQQVSALSASLERRVEQRTQHLRQEIGERQRAAEALRDSEQRFRDFASSASDWFWELAPDLRFSFLSERFEQATGIPPGQVLGKSHDEVGQPDQRDEVWVRHLEDVAARRPFRDFRLVQFQPDGTPVYVSLNGT
ncbi:MAG: PAS domain S-box protein, partial [Gammaproteobacteria bacterium]|nr:PAS domain S-box protein [Gammaproteobacteria bacterium]NIR84309.1 PAS domain S-box protein [Gammaproteobacteria bacterium]NIU04291.1 PAS domain S-box protein [Gammaproteobacteria bacterium]NIV51580.1 PAS domain S-box protein [Gammaproteobacteria bacterium]NIX85565.1 PAS domain S-box protein [Gammaproteobacteria bacterium]